jgi:hypothetical protein
MRPLEEELGYRHEFGPSCAADTPSTMPSWLIAYKALHRKSLLSFGYIGFVAFSVSAPLSHLVV